MCSHLDGLAAPLPKFLFDRGAAGMISPSPRSTDLGRNPNYSPNPTAAGALSMGPPPIVDRNAPQRGVSEGMLVP